MATANKEVVVTYKLTLTEEEALWLASLTQNSVTAEETEQDQRIRGNIFNAILESSKK